MSDDEFKRIQRWLGSPQHDAAGDVLLWQRFRDAAIADEADDRELRRERDRMFSLVVQIARDERLSLDERARLLVEIFRESLFPIADWFRFQRARRAKMLAN